MNAYINGSRAPVKEEITAFDLEVTGHIPAEFEGRWLRNGPNPYGTVDPNSHHWFLGDGMVHGVRLREGKAEWYRNRWVKGTNLARRLGQEPPKGRCYGETGFSPNTSVIGNGDMTWALVEGGTTPISLTYELETIGYDNFGGTLPAGFTAHTKLDKNTGELHGICYTYPHIPDRVQHVVLGKDNQISKVTDIPLNGMPMIHDMSLTENYVIIYDLPVCVDLNMALEGVPFPMAWQPDHQPRVGLMRRDGDASSIIWSEAPECYVFHPVNAYEINKNEENEKVIVDLCRYEKIFDNDRLGPTETKPHLARWTIEPKKGEVREEIINDLAHEFPSHDPRVSTQKHRYAYTADGLELGPTYKTNLDTGESTQHEHGLGRFGGEPLFVPREGSTTEDDGWILVCVNDTKGSPAELVILNAENISDAPTARIHLPQRVPDGFHGAWVPDSEVFSNE